MRDLLKNHRLEAGLFAVGLAALFTGITLVAQPGNGLWGIVGWTLTISGVLCLLGAALLWEPVATKLGNRAPREDPPTRPLTWGDLKTKQVPADPAPHGPEPPDEEQRTFVPPNVTPAYLVSLFEGHTGIQAVKLVKPYVGKWLTVSGALDNVMGFGGFSQLTFDRGSFDDPDRERFTVFMYFDSPEWDDRLAILPPGTPTTVVGRIREADGVTVHLEKCELVDGSEVDQADAP